MKRRSLARLAMGVAALLAGASAPAVAQNQPVQINLNVSPANYSGGCPVTLTVTATFALPAGAPNEAFSGGFFGSPLLPAGLPTNPFPELAVTGARPTTDTLYGKVSQTMKGLLWAHVTTFRQYGSLASASNRVSYTVQCLSGYAPGQSAGQVNWNGSTGGYTPHVPPVGVHVPYPKPAPPQVPPSLHPGPPPPYAPRPVAPGARGQQSFAAAQAPQSDTVNGVRVFSKIIAGRCAPGNPTREYFSGAIYMNGKAQVALQYRWIRSDGAAGQAIAATVVSSHQLVVRDEWDLRTVNYSGWEAVQIISVGGAPANIQSNRATFVCSGILPAARPR